MTTTIGPAIGHGPLTQQGVGTTPGFDAVDIRRLFSVGVQEGVISAGSYEVTQRGAGANLSVDIAATTGDGAVVQGDAVTAQARYHVAPHSAVINETLTTAHATLPRIDQVILELKDNQHDASGSNLAQTRVVAGTATGGATLDNRTGAAALPSSALLLADVLVAATDTAITNSEIRDRRQWALGAYRQLLGDGGGSHTTTSATAVIISAYSTRLECSGAPLMIEFIGRVSHSVAGSGAFIYIYQDGVQLGAPTITAVDGTTGQPPGTFTHRHVFAPTAGSHVFDVYWKVNGAGTATLLNTAAGGLPSLMLIEQARQNTKNNATTTG